MKYLIAIAITLMLALTVSCSTQRNSSSPAADGVDFRQLDDPLLNDINLLSYNGYQLTKGYIDSFCRGDSLVGYEKGFQIAFGIKRDQLNSLQLDANGQQYKKLAQELQGYTAQWEILNQDAQTACRTHAFCMIAEINSESNLGTRSSSNTTSNSAVVVTAKDSAFTMPKVCENAKSDYDRRIQDARDFVVKVMELQLQAQKN